MKIGTLLSFLTCLLLASCGSNIPMGQMSGNSAPMRASSATRNVAPHVAMQYDHYTAQDTLYLYVKFNDAHQVLNVQRIATRFEYTVRPGATERDAVLLRDSVQVTGQQRANPDGSLLLRLKVPRQLVTAPNILQMRLWQKAGSQGHVSSFYTLPLQPDLLHKDFMLLEKETGAPLFRSYVKTGEAVLASYYGSDSTLQVQSYSNALMPALPPMSTRQPPPISAIQPVDTTAYSVGDTIRFQNPGLYLISGRGGASVGLLVRQGTFPQITMAKEMLPPLIYLTTSEEREVIMKSKDPKAAIDDFWLKVARDKENARQLIRTFYTRVEEANRRFTSHKEGWASDRGMVYIIYGRPSNVSRVGTTEAWIYRESASMPYIKFVFNKKENNFTNNYYELIRRREYEENWYSTVSKWRAGITENM
ncbi:GWxTD domain-containing protein [Pontibacter beigongshangensis]|uniref:GWxTD domain-containing protein n=1 Tax=Pontibacter beigongshangensis TaxID=2574733 RepID=UPI001F5144A9|nr:GWxTD domain-containing protein [Pontibacter beigongshangensis]